MQRPASDLELDPDGVVELFLDAYRQGAFPMADFGTAERAAKYARSRRREAGAVAIIRWYSPDPRAILPLDEFHASRTLHRVMRRTGLRFTADACFERVIRACAEPREQKPGEPPSLPWLDETLIRAYCLLHQHGHAHSIEAWVEGGRGGEESRVLVGGIYGVHIGAAFFAESMFCRPELGGTNASNLSLMHLVAHLRARGFALLDVQMGNPHTERFGLQEISRAAYLRKLAAAVGNRVEWGAFDAGEAVRQLASGAV